LPLSFERNVGQTDGSVAFFSRVGDATVYLTRAGAVLSMPSVSGDSVLRLEVSGADPTAAIEGTGELAGKSNYFLGNDPDLWYSEVPHFSRVRYSGVYPGIDLEFYGSDGLLEYDFVVQPEADPGRIAVAFSGAENLRLDAAGNLVVRAGEREIVQRVPVIYQEVDGERQPVSGAYVIGADSTVRFRLESYDRGELLVIDPVVEFATYLGGSSLDRTYDMAVDSSGNIFVVGHTGSSDFPTVDAIDGTVAHFADVFVSKFSPDGSTLLFSTYIGGSDNDQGEGIALDGVGDVYVGGTTRSTDFPMNPSISICFLNPDKCGFQRVHGGGTFDGFLLKLSNDGSSMPVSTYLGGSGDENVHDIALDHDGVGYVHAVGRTTSTDFPTVGAVQPTHGGSSYPDGFLSITTLGLNGLSSSTYLGGSLWDVAFGVATNSVDSPVVVGQTWSTDFPTQNPLQAPHGSSADAFVTVYDNSISAYTGSTFLASSMLDTAKGVAIDGSDNIYAVGQTQASDFPTTAGAFQTTGTSDAFVTKLNSTASALVYSTRLGGSGIDHAMSVAVDDAGAAYVTGQTKSSDFPTHAAVQPVYGGGPSDAFMTKLDSTGSSTPYSTFIGSGWNENTFYAAIALGGIDEVYVAGSTFQSDFPTKAAFQPSYGGGEDAFLVKIGKGSLNFWIASTPIASERSVRPD
jgi:hypothetical protein